MSTPLIINGRLFLSSPDETKPLAIVSLLYNRFPRKILHTHLPPLYAGKIPLLLAKYKDETPVSPESSSPPLVMKHIFLNWAREQQLSEIITMDSSGNDPSYARAWEIVNKIEGYEPFLKELRSK